MGRKRERQANLQRLGSVLPGILKKHNIAFNAEEDRLLLDVWQKAVGKRISAQTRPDRLRRNTLFVKVSSSAWMQQLHILKMEILEKINTLLGKELVRDVHFSIGNVSPAALTDSYKVSLSPESYPLKERDKKMIEKSISQVSDPELKEILRRVMTKNIIRRRVSSPRKVL